MGDEGAGGGGEGAGGGRRGAGGGRGEKKREGEREKNRARSARRSKEGGGRQGAGGGGKGAGGGEAYPLSIPS